MVLKIITYPNEILNKKCRTIEENSKDLQKLISDMFETLNYTGGAGLAAPQVGKDIRLFIVASRLFQKRRVFINPILNLVNGSEYSKLDIEGCLSIPRRTFRVKRFLKVRATYLDENFEERSQIFEGFYARILQHEYDHLRGITLMNSNNSILESMDNYEDFIYS